MKHLDEVVTKMRTRHGLKSSESAGVVGMVCKETMVSDSERDIEVVMNTADVDLQDEVVLPGGCDTSYFMSYGQKKVFQDHWYDTRHNVGVLRWMNPFPNAQNPTALKARIHIYANLRDPAADDLLEKIKQGGMGLSIGFVPIDSGEPNEAERRLYPKAESIVRKWRMLEVSFTPLPCNVRCQTVGAPISEAKTIRVLPSPKVIRI